MRTQISVSLDSSSTPIFKMVKDGAILCHDSNMYLLFMHASGRMVFLLETLHSYITTRSYSNLLRCFEIMLFY